MNNEKLLEYILFTPNERLPPMPDSIQNEKCLELGLKIEELLKSKKIQIECMDENGFLHVTHK